MYLQFAVNEKCVLGEYLESFIKRATSHRCTGARLSDSIIKSLKISLGGIQQGIREFIMSDVKILMYVKTRWINNRFLLCFESMLKRNIRSNPEPRETHRKIISWNTFLKCLPENPHSRYSLPSPRKQTQEIYFHSDNWYNFSSSKTTAKANVCVCVCVLYDILIKI